MDFCRVGHTAVRSTENGQLYAKFYRVWPNQSLTDVFVRPKELLDIVTELKTGLNQGQKPVLVMGMASQALENEVLEAVGKLKEQVGQNFIY